MTLRIFRVIVRGAFAGLDADQRAALLANADAHDPIRTARFDEVGTVTYERSLNFFTFRYQLRSNEEAAADARAAVIATAEQRATAYLAEAGWGHGPLRSVATDMADMWRRGGDDRER
jgi:hypothetical protein